MKPLLILCLLIFGLTSFTVLRAQSPVANAGLDQTIYLTQTNTATLNGSGSSGDSYQWTEVSTDYKSGATITSPNSAVTTVTGLPQGVFYFQLAVTSGGVTATDQVAIIVDYDVPPANNTLVTHAIWSDMAYGANLRNDTTTCFSWTSDIRSLVGTNPNAYIMEKDGTLGSSIDAMNQKYYSILNDGHGCSGYGRSELIPAQHAQDLVDTSKTYVIEWKGYFPQDMSTVAVTDFAGVIGQIHGNDGYSPPFGYAIRNNQIYLAESFENGNGLGSPIYNPSINSYNYLMSAGDLVNQTHTFRMTLREGKGYTGQKAFLEIKIDGVRKYYRNVGQVGSTLMEDWIKGATMYDYGNLITDANNHTRGRKVSLTTESYKIYTLNNASPATPTANAGPNQTITLPINSVNLSGSGSVSGGSITGYNWTKLSGPSGESIASPNSSSTSVTNLAQGTYIFQLKVTDNNGATATSSVQITVNPLKQNLLPVASAGANQTIILPVSTTNLTGSGSDSDGTIATYLWSKTNGPSGGSISSPSSASTGISNLQQGEYTFQLKVTDNSGGIGTDTVHISVKTANQSPIADAGADQNIVLPINTINLSGKGTDVDGTIASYQWSKISGNTCTISSANSSSTSVNGLTEGTYQFQITVTDNQGATGKDTVLVSVKAGANIIPTASAGADQTVTLPTNSVTLKGSGVDTDGTIASYLWSKISGPAATISNSSSATTNVTSLLQGIYQFELKVTDDKGGTAKDTVQVTVLADTTTSSTQVKPNVAPFANAGADQTITLPTNKVTLTGSGNDSDGTIASYSWTKISGPTFKMSNPSSKTVNVTSLLQGIYQFELKVTDDKGAIAKDTVQVTVLADTTTSSTQVKPNVAPIANAGADQTITLPTNNVILSGSGSDSDGTIASYLWTKISGPAATITNVSSATTSASGLVQGTYQFELKVTDDKGATAKDTVQITVLTDTTISSTQVKPNVAPTANAGTDQTITLPTNSVILSGSGSDSDGTIASYSWTKVSGPSSFSITNSSSATAKITGLVQGTYQFQVKVTDDKGAAASDTVKVTVNDTTSSIQIKPNLAPTANAGTDQTITLPTNKVTLTGNGNDSDGTIASYSWTKISGPAATIVNASSATTSASGLLQGTYQFELKVTDDKGATAKDTVQITVLPDTTTTSSPIQQNIAPTANAGSDITTVSTVQFVTINGSGIDPDGQIESYLWTQVSGPSTASISASNSATIKVRNLVEGTYEFELEVTDDKGAIGRDTVKVTVALQRTSTENITVKTTSLKVYPNPVHDIATVEITAPQVNTNVMIVISDINGKTVYSTQFVSSSIYIQQQIDMSNLIKGTYFITVYFDGMQQQSAKVMRL